MSPSDDDAGVTPRRAPLDDRTADALLSGHPVVGEELLGAFVAQMQTFEPASPPQPSAQLAAMLEVGIPAGAAPSAPPARRRRFASAVSWGLPLQTALGGLALTGLVLGAASTNSLPAPVQTAVADVVEAVTPLTIPRPPAARPAPQAPNQAPQGPVSRTPSDDADSNRPADRSEGRDSDGRTDTRQDGDRRDDSDLQETGNDRDGSPKPAGQERAEESSAKPKPADNDSGDDSTQSPAPQTDRSDRDDS